MTLVAFVLGIVAPLTLGGAAGLLMYFGALRLERWYQNRQLNSVMRIGDGRRAKPSAQQTDHRERRLAELRHRRVTAFRSLSTPAAPPAMVVGKSDPEEATMPGPPDPPALPNFLRQDNAPARHAPNPGRGNGEQNGGIT
jgi:hypothetical protein